MDTWNELRSVIFGGENHAVFVAPKVISGVVDGIDDVGVEVIEVPVTVRISVIVVCANDTVMVVGSSLVIVIVNVESGIGAEAVVMYEKEKG